MGYNLYITENGDSLDTYTIYQTKTYIRPGERSNASFNQHTDIALYPVGLFEYKDEKNLLLPVRLFV